MKYEFNSLRGKNFVVEGENPQDAWENLVKQEFNEGSLWRCNDAYCNRYAVENAGFSCLVANDYWHPVFKVVPDAATKENSNAS